MLGGIAATVRGTQMKPHSIGIVMSRTSKWAYGALLVGPVSTVLAVFPLLATAQPDATPSTPETPNVVLNGEGPGWRALTQEDFTNVNCDPDTWKWNSDGSISCTGTPVGVIRTKNKVANFELVVNWRHLKSAGNSGVFVWVTEESVANLERGKLPHGIEVQILDHGYAAEYEKQTGKKGDWFSTNGDVFPVGVSKMTPFPPLSPNGERSFPSKNLSKGHGEWNHYYIRAINGEVRLWVNGEEVSGGTGCTPNTGYLALESEGSPIEFRNLRIRELP
ncbi:MAG: glycosyl hydrolase [Candidatus Hydrogenedentota bacterium]